MSIMVKVTNLELMEVSRALWQWRDDFAKILREGDELGYQKTEEYREYRREYRTVDRVYQTVKEAICASNNLVTNLYIPENLVERFQVYFKNKVYNMDRYERLEEAVKIYGLLAKFNTAEYEIADRICKTILVEEVAANEEA